MIKQLFFAAIAAGLLAGVVTTGTQMLKVVPLIHKAETYETAQASNNQTTPSSSQSESQGHGQDAKATDGHSHSHGHDSGAWAPHDGFERFSFTLLSNILTGVAFACLLGAAIMFFNGTVSVKHGLLWGAAGFFVFSFAPALGLPPELPGMESAALSDRQGWWVLTAVCSAAGLALIAFREAIVWRLLGVAVIVAPHVIGAPHPATTQSLVPAELSAEFAIASVATAAVFWLILGSSLCGFLERFRRNAGASG